MSEMSTSESIAARTLTTQPVSLLRRIERRLERWEDHLNPILVKEARQALKSRQFTITFTLMLIAAWTWSVVGIVSQMPDIYYATSGEKMLIGYYLILAGPLLLIVPFSAFRSLAIEREDQTYELLAISTLSSRQIVTGKLGSAILQMVVYYSALAPCIAFTYLLRGVDIVSLLLLLVYTFALSVLLCCLGLVFAGLSRSRQWQSMVSVLFLLILIGVGNMWAIMFVALFILRELNELRLDNLAFWVVQAAIATALVTYVAILILVASAQNSFASDNRSTRIRIAISVQTILFVGWGAYAWVELRSLDLMYAIATIAIIHWYVYGVLMSGESARMSPRIQRTLPKSFFGRTFLTWFNPGSGTGYVFAVSHVLVIMGLVVLAVEVQRSFNVPTPQYVNFQESANLMTLAVLFAGYYIVYIGVSRLVLLLIRDRERYGLSLPVLINLILLTLGCAIPYFYELAKNQYRDARYTTLQVTNWYWTIGETVGLGLVDGTVVVLVLAAAVVILVINLSRVRAEIESVRMDAPERVQLDDEVISRQDRACL